MDAFGKSPIPVLMLILGKLAVLLCFLFFLAKNLEIEMLYNSPTTQIIAGLLVVVGIAIFTPGLFHLGKSVSVGLPQEKTELKTHGIYRITRNPMYLGGIFICIGSCLFSIHILNFLFCAIGVGIHHWIVLKEEKFLEERFGQRWVEYKKHVPRYLGNIRRYDN